MGSFSAYYYLFFALIFMAELEFSTSQRSSNVTIKCTKTERIALIRFKETIADESSRLSSWMGDECCAWEGVICSNKTGHVIKLDLHNPTPFDYDKFYNPNEVSYAVNYSKSCLSGEVSPSLLDLEHLEYLDLSMNNFSGSGIPEFFGAFRRLRYLDLSVTRFAGNVPPNLGNLSRLEYLDLSDFWTNQLTAESLRWVTSLSSLKNFDISGVNLRRAKDWLESINMVSSLVHLNLSNTLVGTIPSLSHVNLSSLEAIDLQWNTIDSFLPQWLFNISSLVQLRVDGNGFRGEMPQELGGLSNLEVLGLSSNFFNTSVPNSLFNLSRLTHLDLSQNKFRGVLPNAIAKLCNLRLLDLAENKLTGEIPNFGVNQYGCLQNLSYLSLSYNSFVGPIPTTLGTLSSLKVLDVGNNPLNGNIPSSLGQLSRLEKLDVTNNSLSGIVSEQHFVKMSSLKELFLSKNKLVLNVSSQWVPPFQLKNINLASCVLGPQFPPWLQTQVGVEELRISKANIEDRLPNWFEKVYSHVHYLDLSSNKINGQLPEFKESHIPSRRLIFHSNQFEGPLKPLPSDVLLFDASHNMLTGGIPIQNARNLTLEVLILSHNQLTGQIPNFLCSVNTLMILDIANNKFSGKLPECIGEIENLAMLDVSNNSLLGEIPRSLTALGLLSLRVHGNRFQGHIPSLQNMTFLNVLDVGRNEFSGVIPHWIDENMQNLKFLSLQANNFNGEIPQFLCQLPQLQLLNLAQNNITGKIPECIGNLSGMIVKHDRLEYLTLDVDYGASVYEIVNGIERQYTKTMPFLTSLDLSDNRISGQIPRNLTNLAGLLNLNLAGNNLTGRIPDDIGDMKQLVSVDLSRNELSGPIPLSLSDLTYLSHLNLSFNNLSGPIPPGNQLQALDDPESIYMGNNGLCGPPLAKSCSGNAPDNSSNQSNPAEDGKDKESFFLWFYAGIGPGFLFGFLVICGILHFIPSWRYACFDFVESMVTTRRQTKRQTGRRRG